MDRDDALDWLLYGKAIAEIERLRLKLGQAEKIAKLLPESAAEIERLRAQLWTDDEVEHEMTLARNAAIEECARVAEGLYSSQDELVRAIRALKGKP